MTNKDRVKLELEELKERNEKLKTFTDGADYPTLDDISRKLIDTQYEIQRAYINVLELRLSNWDD